MRINADVNAKNRITMEYVIKDLFGLLATANVNVRNHVMLENTQIMKILNVEKD